MRHKGAWFGCAGLVVLALFAYVYGSAIVLYCASKRAVKDDASLGRSPDAIPTNKTAQAAGTALSFFGMEFQVPWSGEPQVKQWQRAARIQFPEGQFVMLFDPSSHVDRIKVLGESSRGLGVEKVFGKHSMESNYTLVQAILNASPKDISLWKPRIELVRSCVFLMLKKGELTNTQTGLFHFDDGATKGFQKGAPEKAQVVDLDVFDNSNREYEMLVGRTTGTNGRVTQEDINLILSTIRAKPTLAQQTSRAKRLPQR